jgi:hypothetical protein
VLVAAGAAVWFRVELGPAWVLTKQTAESLWTHLLAQSLWPNWTAYAVGIPSAVAVVYLGWRYLDNKKNSHRRFKELPYLGSIWRWNSLSDLPNALQPYCPSCQGLLVYEELGGRYGNQAQSVALHCEACQTIPTEQSGTWKYLQARVAREIQRLIRTGEWRQHVPGH